MKRLAVILGFIFSYVYGQTYFDYGQKDYVYKGKTYKVYTSLEDADKVNPDSVFCLALKSKGFKNFPKEVLKYKNLQILDLSAFNELEVYDSLMTKEEKRKADKYKRKTPAFIYYPRCYRGNNLFDIPASDVRKLIKLIYMNVDCCHYKLQQMCDLQKVLPNMEIDPPIEYMIFEVKNKECNCH